MPAPVTFSLSLAPLPVNANTYTPQQWAQAVVDRLTIAPSAPWSSFQNGGVIGTSDVGPILYNGKQWKVWDSGSGAYIDLVVEGGGLVARTVQLSALADQSAGALPYYDASAHAAVLTAGTDGKVLTMASGLPSWAALPAGATSTYFEVNTSSTQSFSTNGAAVLVEFNTVKASSGVTFDTTNFRVPVTAGSVWFFWAQLQLARVTTVGASNVSTSLEIRPNGAPGVGVGTLLGYEYAMGQTGIGTSGILAFALDGYADCAIAMLTAVADTSAVQANVSLTRFGGFRIV